MLEPSSYAASEIWVNGRDKALVTAAWQRGELSGARSFKLLVSGDSDFFRAGYSYCLFVLAGDNIKIHVPLAEALAKLLSFHTGLFPMVNGKARRLTYYTLDGKTNVNLLGLRGDGAIVGSEDGTPTHTAALPRKLDELPLPSTTVTARDLVELLQGPPTGFAVNPDRGQP